MPYFYSIRLIFSIAYLNKSISQEKLTDAAPDQAQEVSPAPDQTTAPSARAVENFLSMIDNTNTSRNSGHMEHGAPKLRQLLGSGLATDAVALQADLPLLASFSNTRMWPGNVHKRKLLARLTLKQV